MRTKTKRKTKLRMHSRKNKLTRKIKYGAGFFNKKPKFMKLLKKAKNSESSFIF